MLRPYRIEARRTAIERPSPRLFHPATPGSRTYPPRVPPDGRHWNPRVARLQRRSGRLPGYDYCRPGAYFVTICTNQYGPALSDITSRVVHLTDDGRIVQDCWRAIPAHFSHVRLDAFAVMPNHVHGIIVLTKTDSSAPAVGRIVPGSLGAIVRSFKSAATARINRLSNTPGQKVWQRNTTNTSCAPRPSSTGSGGTSSRIPFDGIVRTDERQTRRGGSLETCRVVGNV